MDLKKEIHGSARHYRGKESDRMKAAGRIGGTRTAAQSEERSWKKHMC
jgi:hypothetical protein